MEKVREEIARKIRAKLSDFYGLPFRPASQDLREQLIVELVDAVLPIEVTEEVTIKDLIEKGRIKAKNRPKIICLCGSTRFTAEMLITQWNFTKQGYIVLSWCALPDAYFQGEDKSHIGDQEGVKEIVDEVHKRKIDLADEVFVLNIGGYIGDSTKSEIKHATEHKKPVKFLEPEWSYPELNQVPRGGKA